MAKLGLHLDRRTTVPDVGQPVEVYAITRRQYLAGTAPAPRRP
jgi:hypothetical protein